MSKKCKECGGRGRWQEELESINSFSGIPSGETELVWMECLNCKGTGISQLAEDGEDFDIAGSGYASEE